VGNGRSLIYTGRLRRAGPTAALAEQQSLLEATLTVWCGPIARHSSGQHWHVATPQLRFAGRCRRLCPV